MSKDENLSNEEMKMAAGGTPDVPSEEIDRSRLRGVDEEDLRRAVGATADTKEIDRSRLRGVDEKDLRRAVGAGSDL